MTRRHVNADPAQLAAGLEARAPSTRLRAALAAGTDPHPDQIDVLVRRCALEPDFYVRDMLTRYRSPFYGPLAFGTSARSSVLTDWPGGGFIGIHGTDTPELLPGRVSHGCIRLRNEDILKLGRLMPVGTPVTIR